MKGWFFFVVAAFSAFLAACAAPARPKPVAAAPSAPAPQPAPPPPQPAPMVVAPVPQTPCFNTQYKFTCSIPASFAMTQEGEGPGEIMTFAPQTLSSNATANFIVRAASLRNLTLDQYVTSRITGDLETAQGIKHWDKFAATYGTYSGIEVAIERDYASGPFRSRIFAFTHGPNVFVLSYSASEDQFDQNKSVIEQFLQSLTFAS